MDTSSSIPAGVTTIGRCAFDNCPNLTTLVVAAPGYKFRGGLPDSCTTTVVDPTLAALGFAAWFGSWNACGIWNAGGPANQQFFSSKSMLEVKSAGKSGGWFSSMSSMEVVLKSPNSAPTGGDVKVNFDEFKRMFKAAKADLLPDFTPPQQQPAALKLKLVALDYQASLFQADGALGPRTAALVENVFIPAARQLFAACVEQSRSMVPEMQKQYHDVRKNHRSIYFDTLQQIRLEPVFPTLQHRSDKLVVDCKQRKRRAAQKATTVIGLLRDAKAVTNRYNMLLKGVGEKTGVPESELHTIGNKGIFRICEKLSLAPTWQPECVQDIVRGAIECKDFTTMVNVLRLLCDLDDGLKITGETGDLKEDIVITRSKGRFGHPTSGGWADIMVNFYFADDPNQHICELQLVHTQLFTVRKKMGAHQSYGIFRAALELCEVVGANPEEGAAPSELEEMVWKDPATLQLQINSPQKHVQEKDAQIAELGAKIA